MSTPAFTLSTDELRALIRDEITSALGRKLDLAPAPAAPRYLSIRDVAGLLGVSIQTVYNWISAQALIPQRIGRRLRVEATELERFLAAQRPSPDTGSERDIRERAARILGLHARHA